MIAATVPDAPPLADRTEPAASLAQCHGCLTEMPGTFLRSCECGALLCPDCAGFWGSHEHTVVGVTA